jgi:hypothetical protein
MSNLAKRFEMMRSRRSSPTYRYGYGWLSPLQERHVSSITRALILGLPLVLTAVWWFDVYWIVVLNRPGYRSRSVLLPPTYQPKIYFVVTSSIHTSEGEKDAARRRDQYLRGLGTLLGATAKANLPLSHQVIVVENNGVRRTFLDDVTGASVLYTDTNKNSSAKSKGTKELMDVLACVSHYQMRDRDFVVKMTGRYYLDEDSNFMKMMRNLDWNQTQAVVKFGSYKSPSNWRKPDCITGLIMLPVQAIKKIQPAAIIEHSWAKEALALPSELVEAVQGKMGIYIAPAGVKYFLV